MHHKNRAQSGVKLGEVRVVRDTCNASTDRRRPSAASALFHVRHD